MVPYSGKIITGLKASVVSRWIRRAAPKERIASRGSLVLITLQTRRPWPRKEQR